jgi:hypothetical protein
VPRFALAILTASRFNCCSTITTMVDLAIVRRRCIAVPAKLDCRVAFQWAAAGGLGNGVAQLCARVALLSALLLAPTTLVAAETGPGRIPAAGEPVPLPEHPRPDFERGDWLNLNGAWEFRFDKDGVGEKERWQQSPAPFPDTIRVPFSWGSVLSGLGNRADIGWYRRTIRIPEGWRGQRVFLVVGASDWLTSGWLDGKPVGSNRGGYTPFEFELTSAAEPGRDQALESESGAVLHRNFTTFRVARGQAPRDESVKSGGRAQRVVRVAPGAFRSAQWSLKQWNVLDGLKANGAGHGYFEYRLPWPDGLDPAKVGGALFRAELSAKRLHGKDRPDAGKQEGDYMRGLGTLDPSLNPNAYPMTDTTPFPSAVRVRVNGTACGRFDLEDDPADHRGILSWHAQPRDKKLREAGSYGYLVEAAIPAEAIRAAAGARELVVRLEVDAALPGGLAVYGERFGRYPLDPTIVFDLK